MKQIYDKQMTAQHTPPTQPNAQEMLDLLQEISLAVEQAENAKAAFSQVLSHFCRLMAWPIGHVYIWSEVADALVSTGIWHLAEGTHIEPFRELSEATEFQRGEGTIGYIWHTGEPTIILDIQQSDKFVRHLPVDIGIRAYYAFPVTYDAQVLAVLEFFSLQNDAPSQDLSSIINYVSTLLGLTMQRQQTLDRLKQSESQLAEAQRTAHVGYWEWDIVQDKINWSAELYRIYGRNPHTFTATYNAFLETIHPDDLDFAKQKIEDARQNGRSFDYFHRIIRPDGVQRVVHARGRPVFDQAGQIIKLHGTSQDMTEQKEAELQLAKTVRHLSALIEIGQAVSATLELEQVYRLVLTRVRPLLGAEALLLFLSQNDMLEIVALDHDGLPNLQGFRLPPDAGIVGEVWQNGRSRLFTGEACTNRLSTQLTEAANYHPHALMAVPIRWRDNAIGVLEAAHQDADAFTTEDLQLLETAAAWTAIAIGNARQYEQLQRRLNERDAILTITNALTETLELDELLQLIAHNAQEIILNANWATIHLLQHKTNRLELVASAGLQIKPDDYLINLGEGIAGQVMAEGGVLNIPDVQTDTRRLPIDVRTNIRALLVAPVEGRRRRIGTISVQCATPAVFTADDERLLTILGVQAGMAIENARLFTLQRRARIRAEKRREQMRQMARRVMEAQEEERSRIARELHDESGQALTSLKISLDLIRAQLPENLDNIRQQLTDVLALTDKTMSNLRLLSHNLRPPGLDSYGLDAALDGLCQDFEVHTELNVFYEGVKLPELASLTALSLYRFTQEALTNVVKHAEATQVYVTLALESDMIRLTIADNGRGFMPPDFEADETAPQPGAGITGMVERLEMVDGRLQINSTLGEGSALTAVVPFTQETSQIETK